MRIREVAPDDAGAPQRAVGLLLIDAQRDAVWVAMRDPHFGHAEELTEAPLSPTDQQPVLWYQYLDLPWPFADRHWVIEVWDSRAVAKASAGRDWEHWWDLPDRPVERTLEAARLHPPPAPADDVERAIHTPVNEGAWLAISLPGGRTLTGYHVTTVIGGRIPDRLVSDYTMMTLSSVLKGVQERSRTAAAHYDAHHSGAEALLGGDGEPIPPSAQWDPLRRPGPTTP